MGFSEIYVAVFPISKKRINETYVFQAIFNNYFINLIHHNNHCTGFSVNRFSRLTPP